MNEAEIRRYASLMRELDLTGMEIDEKKGVIRLEREKDSSGGSAFLDGAKAQGMDEFSGNSAPSAGTEFLPCGRQPGKRERSGQRDFPHCGSFLRGSG